MTRPLSRMPSHGIPVLLLALALTAGPATATVSDVSQPMLPTAGAARYTVTLGWLNQQRPDPITLQGLAAERTLSLPIPDRLEASQGRLDFFSTHSIVLRPRSLLQVRLNERTIGQLPLQASEPDNQVSMAIPAPSLVGGYHTLKWKAALHSLDRCEDPSAPELAVELDARASSVSIQARWKVLPPVLSSVPALFDSKLWTDQYHAEIWVPPGAERNATWAQSLVHTAQGISGWLDYLPARYSVQTLTPGTPVVSGVNSHDGVLIGTAEQLTRWLPPGFLEGLDGPTLGVVPQVQMPEKLWLVITGRSPDEVAAAARTFSIGRQTLPAEARINTEVLRVANPPGQRVPGDSTRFSARGVAHFKAAGTGSEPLHLDFWANRDQLTLQASTFDLDLDIAYGAGLDKASSLKVLLNDRLVGSVALDEPKGRTVFSQDLQLPVAALRAGLNRLTLVPGMISGAAGSDCFRPSQEPVELTVFGTSQLHVPPPPESMQLPDLSLLTKTGWPLRPGLTADESGARLWLIERDDATVSAALTLVGRLRQTAADAQPWQVMVDNNADWSTPGGSQALLIVGAYSALPAALRPLLGPVDVATATLSHPSEALQAVVFTALRPDTLKSLAGPLTQGKNWNLVGGNQVWIREGGQLVIDHSGAHAQSVGTRLGTFGFWQRYDWHYVALIGLLAGALLIGTVLALRRRARAAASLTETAQEARIIKE